MDNLTSLSIIKLSIIFGRAPYGVATLRASLRSVLRTLRPSRRLTHPPIILGLAENFPAFYEGSW
jgi:hypothetical protein